MLVTRLGVSVLKVVATMEMPISHHGTARPEVKNSAVFFPARRAKKIAGRKQTARERAMIRTSIEVRFMSGLRNSLRFAGCRHAADSLDDIGPEIVDVTIDEVGDIESFVLGQRRQIHGKNHLT
jgi:hypothetical protein